MTAWVRRLPALTIVAGLITAYQYWTTIHYGFYYDDYHFVRPYAAGEIRATFHGPWDSSGIEVPFYRPLTVCFFAARFAVMGLNADAYHVLSLALFGLALVLLGILVTLLCDRLATGLLAIVILAVHPGMPYSAVAWVTNQMHLLELIGVLAGAIWWHFVKARSLAWWLPLVVLQLLLLLVKEDAVMLLPFLVAAQLAAKLTNATDLALPPFTFLALAAIAVGGLLAFRQSALHGLGGYGLPSIDSGWANLTRGLSSVFRLVPAKRPFQLEASWFVTVLPALALIAWRWVPDPERRLVLVGAALSLLFELPFVFVVKVEQLHLVTTGAALVLTGSIAALWHVARWRGLRAVLAAAVVCGLALMSTVAANITRDFDPFGAHVLQNDRIVEGWAAVPVEIREYLRSKRVAGAERTVSPNPAIALPLVGFGLHAPEVNAAGVYFRWMSGTESRLFLGRLAHKATIPLRHEIGAAGQPVAVTISVDGRVLDSLLLTDDAWHHSTLSLRPGDVSGVQKMHDLRVTVDRTWVPANVIPGSDDRRTLGLQMGTPVIQ